MLNNFLFSRLPRHLLLSLFCAFCTIFAVFASVSSIPDSLNNSSWCFFSITQKTNLLISITFIIFFVFYNLILSKCPFSKEVLAFAFIFSLCHLFCLSLDRFESVKFLILNWKSIIGSIAYLFGLMSLSYSFLQLLVRLMKLCVNKPQISFQLGDLHLHRHCILILVFWFPIILFNLPGSAPWDTYAMLIVWSGDIPWVAHHPIFPTVITGTLMDIGNTLGNVNIGALLLLCLNFVVIFSAAIFTIKLCYKLWPNHIFSYLVASFYAVLPIFPFYVQTLYKDSLNFGVTTLLTIVLIELFLNPQWLLKKKNFFLFYVLLTAVGLCRHTGIYLIVILGLIITIYLFVNAYPQKKCVIVVFIAALFSIFAFNGVWTYQKEIKPGSKGEMLSIPFQQTARYMKYYPNEVSQEEYKSIDKLLDASKLGEVYLPYLSDPVKGTMKTNDPAVLKEYFKAWFSMFLKHPGVYFSATMNGIYGYFYLDNNNKYFGNELLSYISQFDHNNGRYPIKYFFDYKYKDSLLKFYNEQFIKLPIVGLFYNCGIYTWLMFFLFFILVKEKQYGKLIIFIPSMLTLCFCVVSPVNGGVRYMLPIISSTPLLVGWTMFSLIHNKRTSV